MKAASRYPYVTMAHGGGGNAAVQANAMGSTSFTVTNSGGEAATLTFTATCSGNITDCSAGPAGGSLSPGASMNVTATYTGVSIGNGSLTLAVRNAYDNATLTYSVVAVTVTANPNAPTVSLAPHLGDRRDVSQCVTNCFEATFSYSTPAYFTFDVPRSTTLLYRSGSAHPHGKLALDVTAPAATPPGAKFRLRLQDPNGSNIVFTNGSQDLYFAQRTSGPTRIGAQFNASSIPTSARLYNAQVSLVDAAGTVGATTTTSVRIIILNDQASPFGAGVRPVGIQRLLHMTDGVIVTDGSGSATFFAGSCPDANVACAFTPPAGEFSTLKSHGGFYHRVYPDGTDLAFYPGGHHRSTVTRFGLPTYIDYQYNAAYNEYVPSAIWDPAGVGTHFTYQTSGTNGGWWRVGSISHIAYRGRSSYFGVDPSNNLASIVDADGKNPYMRYDGNHRVANVHAKNDGMRNYYYGYAATPATIDDPSIVIDGAYTIPRSYQSEPWAVIFSAAAQGKGVNASDPIPALHDSLLRASLTDVKGNKTILSINRFGAADTVRLPMTPNPVIASYDPATGQIKRTVSPTGHVAKFTWNGDKLITTNDSTLGQTVNVEYTTKHSLPRRIHGSVAEQVMTYDTTKTGWPIKTMRVGSTAATTYVTDAAGRPLSVTDPSGHVTSYAYLAGMNNLEKVTAPNGSSTKYERDGYGRVMKTTDPRGSTTTVGYDALYPIWADGPLHNDTTRFQYDALGNMTGVTDARAQLYQSKRNEVGWITKQIDPALRSDTSAYDLAGNVKYARSRQGREVRFEYDSIGRPTKRFGVTGGDTISFKYDPAGRWMRARAVSRNVFVSLDTIHTDSTGRTIRESTLRPNVGGWSVASTYNWNAPDRTSVAVGTWSGGAIAQTSYTYDAEQRPWGLQPYGASPTWLGYNGEQLPATVTFPTGLTETTTYTSGHNIDQRTYNVPAVEAALGRWYRLDSLARVVRRGEASGGRYQTFSYDGAGQLFDWLKKRKLDSSNCIDSSDFGMDCSGTNVVTDTVVTTTYDGVGNPTTLGGAIDPGNRLRTFDGHTMTYDFDGNMLTKSANGVTDAYDWDNFGQLKSVTRGGVIIATFDYDGFGRRIRKTATMQGVTRTVHYIWDGSQIIAEVDGSGTLIQSYSYYPGIDQPHSITVGSPYAGPTYYTSIEPGGDVNALIRASDNAVVAQYTYTPWGEPETNVPLINGVAVNSLRWRGLPYDAETGLYQIRARYYDPRTRRFISEDPTGLAAGINKYTYGANDPVNHTDPSGMDWICVILVKPTDYVEWTSGLRKYGPPEYELKCHDDSKNTVPPDERDPNEPHSSGGSSPDGASSATRVKNALLSCAEEQYGAEGYAQVALAVLGAPVWTKSKGRNYMGGASARKTIASGMFEKFFGNPILGTKPAPHNALYGFKQISWLGSPRVGGAIGRSSLLLTAGFAAYDFTSIALCAEEILQ